MENINKRKIIALSILVLLVISFSVYYLIVYKTKISDFDLRASIADAAGVTEDSHFILKTTESLSTQVIEKYLKTSPQFDFKVKKVSGEENTYEIIPEQKLQIDKIYSLEIDKGPIAAKTFSWAYQIKAPFQLISSIPADKGVDVPSNTGIELYFNRDDIIDPENDIEIYPKVSGKFEVVENGVKFIPKNPLQEKKIYTIKIKSGLKAKDTKDTLSEDKIIKFQTGRNGNYNNPYAYFSRTFSEIKNDSEVLLGVDSSSNVKTSNVSIYKLDSVNEFIDSVSKIQGDTPWATYYDNTNIVLPENKNVFNGSLPLEENNYSNLIRLPQKLDQGYYVAVIENNGDKDVSWFQINPNASFSAFAGTKSLIWLKNINSAQNISGVPILFNNKQVGQTNSDGVAIVDTPSELISDSYYNYENNGKKFFVAQIQNSELAIPIENEYGQTANISKTDKWWDYVSLNKNIYLPTDTINFWSIAKSRSDELIKEDITVKLTSQYWYSEQDNIITYAQTNVKVSDFNAMTGELSFSNLNPGTYQLTFSKGEEVLSQQTVTVSAYVKPAYKIILSPDKNSIFAGENVNFKVKAEFFDGTPVSNVKLEYDAYSNFVEDDKGYFNLDLNGEGSFTIKTKNQNLGYNYWPDYLSVIIKPQGSEEAQIETNSSVYVFGPKINNSIEQKQNENGFTFDIKTREVVLRDRTKASPYWNTEDYLGGPVSGISTKVDIYEIEYVKEQTDTGYDPINKLTYPIYYWKQEDKLKDTKFLISDSNGNSQVSIEGQKGKTYKVEFVSWDKDGFEIKETRYAYFSSYVDLFDYDYGSYYYLDNIDKNKSYKIGETIRLQIQNQQGINLKDSQNNFLFMTVNNGNIEYKIQNSPKFNSIFQYKDIPNIVIWSGWFKDGAFFNAYGENISFDSNEKRLNISIVKDKQSYKPGENVILNLKVTDKNNKPVKAEVNLSALDEAVFSISPSDIDITNDLYRDIYSQIVIRTSNEPPYGGGGAEKGGGGDGGPRSDIKEMAIFKSVETDSNGSAQVEIKLPDNITSWRLTTQAVTKDLFAGKNISFIPVS